MKMPTIRRMWTFYTRVLLGLGAATALTAQAEAAEWRLYTMMESSKVPLAKVEGKKETIWMFYSPDTLQSDGTLRKVWVEYFRTDNFAWDGKTREDDFKAYVSGHVDRGRQLKAEYGLDDEHGAYPIVFEALVNLHIAEPFARSLAEYNCAARETKTTALSIVVKGEWSSFPDSGPWTPVAPETSGEKLMNLVCGEVKKK